MAVLEMLKRLAGRNRSGVEVTSAALEEISSEIAAARAELQAAESAFGARLLEAMANGSGEQVEAELEAKRRRVDRIQRAQAEVQARLRAAESAEESASLAVRWDAAEKSLRIRRLKLARVESLAKEFGRAVLEAEQAARAAWEALPVREVSTGTAVAQSISPHFADLSREVSRLLSLSTDGRLGGHVGSALWALRQEPGLVERAERLADEWRAMRPAELPEKTPPEAA